MLIGLDAGGTHTDGVILDAGTLACLATAKAKTRANDSLPGILEALGTLLAERNPADVKRICVSTTLGLNALLSGENLGVGVLAVPGPGIDPRLFYGADPSLCLLSAAQDHRGRIVKAVNDTEVQSALAGFKKQGIRALGIASKFSPKNPELELQLAECAKSFLGQSFPIFLGSEVSGSLNFPRRLNTVRCNAALAHISLDFIAGLKNAARALGLSCPIFFLKSDAGVFSALQAQKYPAATAGSGPAASILGAWSALEQENSDCLMIDMGGTTTDLAIFGSGLPLLSPTGLNIRGKNTLVRSLWTRSFALGGDSALRVSHGQLQIGPDRQGPALALETEQTTKSAPRQPTLTDALNVAGYTAIGNVQRSLEALAELTENPGSPADTPEALAGLFVRSALQRIASEYAALLSEIRAKPVYTIHELLLGTALKPEKAIFIGGPAEALSQTAAAALRLPVEVPPDSACANALGAALALPTQSACLNADTLLGRLNIAQLGIKRKIAQSYTQANALADIQEALTSEGGNNVQIISSECFTVLEDNGAKGRIIRMEAQTATGLLKASGGQRASRSLETP